MNFQKKSPSFYFQNLTNPLIVVYINFLFGFDFNTGQLGSMTIIVKATQ